MFAKMIKQYPFLEASYVIPSAGIDTIFSTARPAYEPMMWGFGTDRKKPYEYMINKPEYREQLGVNPDFSGFEIKRTDDNISASKVRQAIKNDDEGAFKKMTPKSIHSFYKTLQNELQPIQEKSNYIMENIKSLNEFINFSQSTLNESHFKVGDKVECIKSGMTGEVISLDKEDGDDNEKYYTVKRTDGKKIKYSPNELKLLN